MDHTAALGCLAFKPHSPRCAAIGGDTMDLDTVNAIRVWASEAKVLSSFDCYIFGSLVEDGGEQFNQTTSDIDMALVFKAADKRLDFAARVTALQQLRETMSNLEVLLLRRFKRASAAKFITSITVLTKAEKRYALHKGKDSELLTGKRFVQLATKDISRASFVRVSEPDAASDFELMNRECASVVQEAQAARNSFLQVSANGTEAMAPYDDDTDPLPKKMMRAAAMLRYVEGGKIDDAGRVSIALGGDYLADLIGTQKSHEMVSALHKAVGVRRGNRGTRRALTALEQLIVWEMLFDKAMKLKVATKSERLRAYAHYPRSKR
jgi:predicted nucleotidyltransferase